MKTYKTWEVIKELTENPGKEFETTDFHGRRMTAYNVKEFESNNKTSNDLIVTKSFRDGVEPIILNDFMQNREWKEVKKPVDFMTAIASGKRIKVEHRILQYVDDELRFYQSVEGAIGGLYEYHNDEMRDIILNGEWYIED